MADSVGLAFLFFSNDTTKILSPKGADLFKQIIFSSNLFPCFKSIILFNKNHK